MTCQHFTDESQFELFGLHIFGEGIMLQQDNEPSTPQRFARTTVAYAVVVRHSEIHFHASKIHLFSQRW